MLLVLKVVKQETQVMGMLRVCRILKSLKKENNKIRRWRCGELSPDVQVVKRQETQVVGMLWNCYILRTE